MGFALGGKGPYVCSQGHHGHFTHFYTATQHAIDLNCPVGTDILAVGDGVVKEIKQNNVVSGIHVSNLYKWNSLMLVIDDNNNNNDNNNSNNNNKQIVVEYVHIMENSATLSVGDRVKKGQVICKSGNVGFCPTPHLHIQVHESTDPAAPTVSFCFEKKSKKSMDFLEMGGNILSRENENEKSKTEKSKTEIEIETPNMTFVPIAGHMYNCTGEVI